MQDTFDIVDVFSSTPFGGNQLAVLPNAAEVKITDQSVNLPENRWPPFAGFNLWRSCQLR